MRRFATKELRMGSLAAPPYPVRRSPWNVAGPLLVAIVAFAIYVPALSYEFLNWDDLEYVVNNPWIRAWSSGNLIHIFTKPYYANFLPLHLVSYTFDYGVWGLNPFGYHLHSVLLHVLNSVLALVVVRRMFGGTVVPVLAALFFAVHPSHVEAVAWISIRKDLLSTAFALLTVYFYLCAAGAARIRWVPYLASVACFALGLLSKVSIVTLPAFLLLLDVVVPQEGRRRPWIRCVAEKLPYAAIGLWLVRLNSLAQTEARAPYAQDAVSYAMVKGHAAWNYAGLLFGILRGSPDYDTPALDTGSIALAASLSGLVLLPLAGWLAYRAHRRKLALGLAWIFVTLLPALGFPLVTYMADRYLYLPSLGFCWMLAGALATLAERVATPRWRSAVLAGAALLPAAVFVGRSVEALPVWRNSESLWSYAITRCGDYRAYTNLAEVRLRQRRWDEAERLLGIASRVENPTTYQNYAVLYYERGNYPEAAVAIDRALTTLRRDGWNPSQASALYYSLAAIRWKAGQGEQAIEALEAALRENPSNTQARERLEILRGNPSAR